MTTTGEMDNMSGKNRVVSDDATMSVPREFSDDDGVKQKKIGWERVEH